MSLWFRMWRFRRWMRRNKVLFIPHGPSKDVKRGGVECAGRVS